MASGFAKLPPELLLEIFSYMSVEELALTIRHVDSHWRAVSQDESLWKNKIFSPDRNISDKEIENYLENMPNLRKFSMKRGTKPGVIRVMCDHCKNIQRLELPYHNTIKNYTLKGIAETLKHLEYLTIAMPQRSEHLHLGEILGQFEKLSTLNLDRMYWTTNVDVLKAVADGCSSLQHVNLGYCTFNDQDIKYFLEKKGQQLLSFSVRCYISAETHELLTKCRKLEFLVYKHLNYKLPGSYMELLSNLSNLNDLTIDHFAERHMRYVPDMFSKQSLGKIVKLHIFDCSGFDGALLGTVLRNTPLLKELKLYSYERLDNFLYTRLCEKLDYLRLRNCFHLTDMAIEGISAVCPRLKYLDISSCSKVTNKSIELLSENCQQLEYLDVSKCNGITDSAFEYMKFKKLFQLNIEYHQNITGMHFDKIPPNLSSLSQLSITGCFELITENLDHLQEAMPGLKIKGRPTIYVEEEEGCLLGEAAFLVAQL